jgi:hypothetical protein
MKPLKSLQDSPEYVAARNEVDRCSDELAKNREREIIIQSDITNPKIPIPTRRKLGEELESLQRRQPELAEDSDKAKQQFDAIHGPLSITICQPVRKEFVDVIRDHLIEGMKLISAGNAKLIAIRSNLERDDVSTSSLPSATFDIGGDWDDPHGGKLVGYRRWILANYPELAKEVEFK